MLKWLWCKLIGFGCKWEEVKRIRLDFDDFTHKGQCDRVHFRCATCGMVRKIDLK